MVTCSLNGSGPEVVLAAGIRTPWARAGGAFRKEDAAHLGSLVSRELFARTGLDPANIDEVIAGCVGNPFDQANVARVLALRAGVPRHVPARTVARNCASGMESVTTAIQTLLAGQGDLFLCVGVEMMSSYPLVFGDKMTGLFERLMKARSLGARLGALASFRPSMLAPRITLLDGLTDPTTGLIMGKTAELLAREFGISRQDQDLFACESHNRAEASQKSGRFQREIVPVLPLGARAGKPALDHDDGVRNGQNMAALSKMKPYFVKPDGTVTVANSCGITDGACALLITTAERARALDIQPLARIRGFAWSGCDPSRMGLGPVYSSARALDAANLSLGDMEVIEINEAFAAQVLGCKAGFESKTFGREELGRSGAVGELDLARTNVHGGAIALGHPVGATGSRLLLTLAHELQERGGGLGLATLCIGGGQGGSVILEHAP